MGVFVGSSVFAETSTGGVDDSYPELAAGDDSEPCDSCTLNYNVHRCMTQAEQANNTLIHMVQITVMVRLGYLINRCYKFVNDNAERNARP